MHNRLCRSEEPVLRHPLTRRGSEDRPHALGTALQCPGFSGNQAEDLAMTPSFRHIRSVSRAQALDAAPKIVAALSVAALMALAACHTTAGAGKDISAAGNAIHNEAVEHTP
jgi:predicted small secreted protein